MRRLLRWHEVTNFSLERSGQLKFSAKQIEALSQKLVGHIVLPQDDDYRSSRETFMNAFQHFPQIIIYCQGFADVVEAIRFAHEVKLRPVCRSGGHSTAGYSVNDDMVIDVSKMNYVKVDPAARKAWVGAGAHFAQVNATLQLYGFHIPGGGCETVGVAGYMQGGGYSFTSLMFGMNCDNVTGLQMALADGSIVTANKNENPDLFWAVRGGTGNNFGVLLEIEYKVRKLGTLWGFGYKWPLKTAKQAAAASKALAVWQANFTGDNVPEKFGHQALLVHTQSKTDKQLEPYFVVRGMFNGSQAECHRTLEPLLKLMPDEKDYRDIWRRGTYRELNEFLLIHPTELPPNVPNSARSLAKSHTVARLLSAEEWAEIVALYRSNPNTDNFIGLEPAGGAINAVAPDATAFWHRRNSLNTVLFAFWLHEHEREIAEKYIAKYDEILKPLGNGHSYQNYPNRKNQNFGEMYFGGNLSRLLQVKHAYDPHNFFTFPQGLIEAAGNAAAARA